MVFLIIKFYNIIVRDLYYYNYSFYIFTLFKFKLLVYDKLNILIINNKSLDFLTNTILNFSLIYLLLN